MSERNVMDCGEFSDVAAELALGVLTGRERGDALAHLERCDACLAAVRQLAMTGEELAALLPAVEPPPGFETRVLDRIGLARPGAAPKSPKFLKSRSRRLVSVAAAALAVLVAGLGGWGLRSATAPPASPGDRTPLSSAALVSGHRMVGDVFYYSSGRPWLYMWVDDLPSSERSVTCQLERPDGHYTTVGSFQLAGGYGAWGSPAPWAGGPVTGARVVGPGGQVLATARFR
ncbi:MAG: hypothetical protein J2P25_16830 [Nocardiopsaceae bacterium]|nr:hypothetical protein [Nocardiopsaceae bacterium]